ncbi:MAG TPA: STAS domain-containing protein [Actinomycetota bacterium]|nr:STAS domain-containing protein [Actinomycetota bacterium]
MHTKPDGDWMVVHLQGEVDLASAPQLRRGIYDLIDQGNHRIAIDLTGVEFMDSTGLGVLIGALKRLREAGGAMVLAGIRPAVGRVLEITGLDRIFTIHGSLSEIGVASAGGS